MTIKKGKKTTKKGGSSSEVTTKVSTQEVHHSHEETMTKGSFCKESRHTTETEKRKNMLMDAQGNVLKVTETTTSTSGSPSPPPTSSNANLEQLDMLAASLINSANNISNDTANSSTTMISSTSSSSTQQHHVQSNGTNQHQPEIVHKIIYESNVQEHQGGNSPSSQTRLVENQKNLSSSVNSSVNSNVNSSMNSSVVKEEKTSTSTSNVADYSANMDYATSYYVERTESTNGGYQPEQRTNDNTTIVRTITTDNNATTTGQRNDSVEVQDVVDFATTANSQHHQGYEEYETKVLRVITEDVIIDDAGNPTPGVQVTTTTTSYKPNSSSWDGTFTYEKPQTLSPQNRRRNVKRSGTIDIREVTEDNSINEADYCTSSNYTVQHATSGQELASNNYQVIETTKWDGEYIPDAPGDIIEETVIRHEIIETVETIPGAPVVVGTDSNAHYTSEYTTTWDNSYQQHQDVRDSSSVERIIETRRSSSPRPVTKNVTVEKESLEKTSRDTTETTRRSQTPDRPRVNYTTSSTSAWDGTFVVEKNNTTDRKSVEKDTVLQDTKTTTITRDTRSRTPQPSGGKVEVTEVNIEVTGPTPVPKETTTTRHYTTSDATDASSTFIRKEVEIIVEDSKPPPIPRSPTPDRYTSTSTVTKLNSSTWDGSFVPEQKPIPRRQSSPEKIVTTTVVYDVADSRTDNQQTVQESKYVVDQSMSTSFTSIRDFHTVDEGYSTLRNVDEKDTTSMVTQDVNKQAYESITTRSSSVTRDVTPEFVPEAASTPKKEGPKKKPEDTVPMTPVTTEVMKTIAIKEQCICELCTCGWENDSTRSDDIVEIYCHEIIEDYEIEDDGRHRCPHNDFSDHLEIPHEPITTVTSYKEEYDEKHVDRQSKFYHEDHLRMEGEFIGERRTDFTVTRGERAPIVKPQDNLRPEGEFESITTTELVFTGVTGERPRPERRNTYTKVEGEFTDVTTSRTEFVDHQTVQKAEIIRRTDNLTTEGDFIGTSHVKEDFVIYDVTPQPKPIKPIDEDDSGFYEKTDVQNVTTTREEFHIHEVEDYRKVTTTKHEDNLKMEGTFESITVNEEEFVPMITERPEPIKPVDNLKPEGVIEVTRTRDDFVDYVIVERAEVTKHEDNLKMEGEFIDTRTRDDYQVVKGERMEVIKHEDNLKPEGEFVRPEKPKPLPLPEKRTPIKHPDNLKPEGKFEQRKPEEFKPAERPTPIKPQDNLKPEGDFPKRPKEEAPKGERAEVKKPQDNLKPEGDFERPKPKEFKPAERPTPIKPQDNLKPEGKFEVPEKTPYGPGERRSPIRQQDNLKPEGKFERPKPKEFKPAERPVQVIPQDNLRPEGKMEIPEKKPVGPGERRSPIRQPDNLKPEGKFERPKPKEFKPAERPVQVIPQDNLRPEGKMEIPEKKPVGPGERRSPIRQPDNLKPEGEFERPKPKEFKPAERPTQKKPQDNLKTEGKMDIPVKKPIGPGERRTPIKQKDNLKPEGEFERPKPKEFKPAERPVQKKPKDNLKPGEGEFTQRPKEKAPVKGERAQIVKHEDNLHMEGNMQVITSRDDYTDFVVRERAEVTKYQDNLRLEGDFIDMRTRDDYKVVKGERVDIVKHEDNLKIEGKFEVPEKAPVGPAERRSPIRQPDNLKPEGEFERPKPKEFKPAERPTPKKPQDNLKTEGKMDIPVKKPVGPGERRSPIRQPDNLKPEGEFERPKPKEFKPAERPTPKKPQDNLKPAEGEFTQRPKEKAPIKGDRAEIKKPKDNLKPEGKLEIPKKAPVGPSEKRTLIKHTDNLKIEGKMEIPEKKPVAPAEKRTLIKHTDNLKIEGKMEIPEKKPVAPAEKRTLIKHTDNLKIEGKFEVHQKAPVGPAEKRTLIKHTDNLKIEGKFEVPQKAPVGPAEKRTLIKQTDNLKIEGEFVRRVVEKAPTKGERAPVKKPQDTLKPEGPFEGRPKDDFKVVKGERAEVVRRTDNLHMEGNMQVVTSRDDYKNFVVRERAEVTKYQDNLKMEGQFIDMRTRDDYKVVKGERVEIIKHQDNLKIEGDFVRPEKPKTQPTGPGERRSPIKHADNLKPEGDFQKPMPKEFKPAERPKPIVPQDNLKPEGEFEKAPKPKAPTTIERRTLIKHEDNLKVEGDFTKKQVDQRVIQKKERTEIKADKMERRNVVRHTDLKTESDFEKTLRVEDKQTSQQQQVCKSSLHMDAEYRNRKSEYLFISADRKPEPVVNTTTTVQIRDDKHLQEKLTRREDHLASRTSYTDVQKHQDKYSGATMETKTVKNEAYTPTSRMTEVHQYGSYSSGPIVSPSNTVTKVDRTSMSSASKTQSSIHREEHEVKKYEDTSSAVRNLSPTRSHKRWNVINATTDISNTALHRRIAERDSPQREFGQEFISSHEKKTYKESNRENLSSATYDHKSKQVMKSQSPPKDNLAVGGSFYHASEARNYGSFLATDKMQKLERVKKQSNTSHIKLGNEEIDRAETSLYKREFTSRQSGPCPAALLEAKKAPFKHTRDTPKHKFYLPVVETN